MEDGKKRMALIFRPTLEEAGSYGEEFRMIPLSCIIDMGEKSPLEVLKKLKTVSHHCYMLESLENPEEWGRYTFLGFDPLLELTCQNGEVKIHSGTEFVVETLDPGNQIRKILKENRSPRIQGYPPFTGGLVGYFSYDYVKYGEPTLNLQGEDTEGFRDADLMLFDKVIAFDHLEKKILLIVNFRTDRMETNYRKGVLELEQMVQLIEKEREEETFSGSLMSPFSALFSKEQYCRMVEKAKNYIVEGDIFQVVLSNRMSADFEGSLLSTYETLRRTDPSPYMFYLSGEDLEIAGASPETLVKLKDGVLHTFPLAGTRPRGTNEEEDRALEKELLSDPKELAEHDMLVDLGRNDLGRISQFGSVEVEQYRTIERFSHVMHIGSTVRGLIRADKDALDALDAILPAGTLSGAPKLRACQIIDELENNKRGIYGGAIGYLDFTGNMDTCIAIRIAYKKNGKVFVRSGAGIVADSIPEMEYQECLNKTRAVMQALEQTSEVRNS